MRRNVRTATHPTLALVALALSGCAGLEPLAEPVPPEMLDAVAAQVRTTPLSAIPFEHVEGSLEFSTSPSTGGDHYPFWTNCGFYEVALIEGAATHSLEHGAVWVTYNDTVRDDDLAILRQLSRENRRLLISPYEHEEPIVLSAWGAQLRGVQSADDPSIRAFIELWQDNPDLPEASASCDGAIGQPPDVADRFMNGELLPPEYLG